MATGRDAEEGGEDACSLHGHHHGQPNVSKFVEEVYDDEYDDDYDDDYDDEGYDDDFDEEYGEYGPSDDCDEDDDDVACGSRAIARRRAEYQQRLQITEATNGRITELVRRQLAAVPEGDMSAPTLALARLVLQGVVAALGDRVAALFSRWRARDETLEDWAVTTLTRLVHALPWVAWLVVADGDATDGSGPTGEPLLVHFVEAMVALCSGPASNGSLLDALGAQGIECRRATVGRLLTVALGTASPMLVTKTVQALRCCESPKLWGCLWRNPDFTETLLQLTDRVLAEEYAPSHDAGAGAGAGVGSPVWSNEVINCLCLFQLMATGLRRNWTVAEDEDAGGADGAGEADDTAAVVGSTAVRLVQLCHRTIGLGGTLHVMPALAALCVQADMETLQVVQGYGLLAHTLQLAAHAGEATEEIHRDTVRFALEIVSAFTRWGGPGEGGAAVADLVLRSPAALEAIVGAAEAPWVLEAVGDPSQHYDNRHVVMHLANIMQDSTVTLEYVQALARSPVGARLLGLVPKWAHAQGRGVARSDFATTLTLALASLLQHLDSMLTAEGGEDALSHAAAKALAATCATAATHMLSCIPYNRDWQRLALACAIVEQRCLGVRVG